MVDGGKASVHGGQHPTVEPGSRKMVAESWVRRKPSRLVRLRGAGGRLEVRGFGLFVPEENILGAMELVLV